MIASRSLTLSYDVVGIEGPITFHLGLDTAMHQRKPWPGAGLGNHPMKLRVEVKYAFAVKLACAQSDAALRWGRAL
jgi:hypothetical protein